MWHWLNTKEARSTNKTKDARSWQESTRKPFTQQRWARTRSGSGLLPILAGSTLDRTAIFFKIGGSALDRTEKTFVVLMWLFWKYQNFWLWSDFTGVLNGSAYFAIKYKTLLGLFCNSNCIHLCSQSHISWSLSSNVNIVEWLVFMPAVGLFAGSLLTISFGLKCRGYTFDRSAFNVLYQKV